MTGGSVGAGTKCWTLNTSPPFMLFVAASQLLMARDDLSFLVLSSYSEDVTHELRVL